MISTEPKYDPRSQFDRSDEGLLASVRSHVLRRIEETSIGEHPFYHAFVESIFPADFYDLVLSHMLACKYSDNLQDRVQDNPSFLNKRYNLFESKNRVVAVIRAVFSDEDVKRNLFRKFYTNNIDNLACNTHIHEEFEYFFTKSGKFQNIHVDIPPKFLSFVFYLPECAANPSEEERNATILYDKNLTAHYKARFRPNSVCIFAPHFSSYHGFSSTIDRDVLVLFYVMRETLLKWQKNRQQRVEVAPFTGLLDAIEEKLTAYPLIEFGADAQRLRLERQSCLVNAPQGRVFLDEVAAHRTATENESGTAQSLR